MKTVFDIAILFRRLVAVVSMMVIVLMLRPATADEWDDADALLSAVVGIQATIPPQARTAESLGTERAGSGIVIDASGLIVTIGYLILEAEKVEIMLADGQLTPVDIVAYDHESGFGLLRSSADLDVQPMALGSSARLTLGERLLIASQGGIDTLRPAIFTGKREFAGYWEYLLEDALFTVPPYPQFGGAALIGPSGKLVGIGSLVVGDAYYDGDQLVPGNMFLPVDRLKSTLGDLLTEGRSSGPRRPWLGMHTEETESGLLVMRVAEDGPAMSAGVEPGDIVTATGGEVIVSMADFYRKVWGQGVAGDMISITVIRGADSREVTIRSGDRYEWLHLRRGD